MILMVNVMVEKVRSKIAAYPFLSYNYTWFLMHCKIHMNRAILWVNTTDRIQRKGTFLMDLWDILVIGFIVVAVIIAAIYFFNRWAGSKLADHNSMIERSKQPMSIYVIDKKKDKLSNANFPKAVHDQMPRWNKFMKMPLVKAKVGPQIVTLMCDKVVFDALPIKKTVKVDVAGMYIVHMKGMKSKKEMETLRKERKGAAGPWYKRLIGR